MSAAHEDELPRFEPVGVLLRPRHLCSLRLRWKQPDGSSQQASGSADNAALPSSSVGAVTLSWLPPTTNTNGTTLTDLAGYRIYYGQSPTAMTEVIAISNAGLTAYMVENLSAGTWYFAIKAVTTTGIESSLSNVASTTIS